MRPEESRDEHDELDAQARAGRRRDRGAEIAELLAQISAWRRSLSGDRPERLGPQRVALDPRERVVQGDRVALELQVLGGLLQVDGGHVEDRSGRPAGRSARGPRIRGRCRRPISPRCAGTAPPTSPRRCRASRSGCASPRSR